MESLPQKYQLLKPLGHGGYGSVYLVQHRDLGIQYALKVLNEQLSHDPHVVESFRHEAGILARFSHPSCAQLRDFGTTPTGLYYMALDFIEGQTLERILRDEEWMPVMRALQITADCLEVLAAAHEYGVIHRDMKPGNIMVQSRPDGKVVTRVLDFGIAKLLANPEFDPALPGEGQVAGTPGYMAPELILCEENIDRRVDVYAVGVMLYEMLTGVLPFRDENVVAVLTKHLTQPIPPFAQRLGIPEVVERIVFKAMAKRPSERFQSAVDFLSECRALLADIGADAAPAVDESHRAFAVEGGEADAVEDVDSGPLSILCLDDNEMILNISKHILEREGHRVFTATSFNVIYDLLSIHKCRLMLCDVEMPELSGPKIVQILKRSVPDLTIILFSNINERDLEKLAQECGADSWLSKNTTPDKWIEKVREVLAARRAGSAAQPAIAP